ncbi:unnamed protein product [Urochloa humidicola]
MATNMYGGATVACRVCYRDQHGTPRELSCTPQRKWMNGYHLMFTLCQWKPDGGGRSDGSLLRRGWDVSCCSCNGSCQTKECESSEDGAGPYRDFKQHSRGNTQFSDDQVASKMKSAYASQGLAEACKFVYNDAKFVNERAQNDIPLLSRGITRLNKRT